MKSRRWTRRTEAALVEASVPEQIVAGRTCNDEKWLVLSPRQRGEVRGAKGQTDDVGQVHRGQPDLLPAAFRHLVGQVGVAVGVPEWREPAARWVPPTVAMRVSHDGSGFAPPLADAVAALGPPAILHRQLCMLVDRLVACGSSETLLADAELGGMNRKSMGMLAQLDAAFEASVDVEALVAPDPLQGRIMAFEPLVRQLHHRSSSHLRHAQSELGADHSDLLDQAIGHYDLDLWMHVHRIAERALAQWQVLSLLAAVARSRSTADHGAGESPEETSRLAQVLCDEVESLCHDLVARRRQILAVGSAFARAVGFGESRSLGSAHRRLARSPRLRHAATQLSTMVDAHLALVDASPDETPVWVPQLGVSLQRPEMQMADRVESAWLQVRLESRKRAQMAQMMVERMIAGRRS